MAQIDLTVGAIEANAEKIIAILLKEQKNHEVIAFPELALTGYPPEDLLFRDASHQRVETALQRIAEASADCHVIVGHPSLEEGKCFNSASVFYQGKRVLLYHKQKLPNYGVFDEARYFSPGQKEVGLLTIKGYRIALCICEDLWQTGPVEQSVAAQADALICINSSPFDYLKPALREALLENKARQGVAICYVNQIGGQDELVFDGQSLAFDCTGKIQARAMPFVEQLQTVTLQGKTLRSKIHPPLQKEALIYAALVCGTRDYVEKNGFPGVLLGLSGGIDSALTLAIAVDALGANRVQAVMMPSRYTADMSNEDAQRELESLGVVGITLPIEPAFLSILATLEPVFKGLAKDTTEENIQARIRGILLMALSNKTGRMVLTTSNKSETAVGYATLYGDMAGGFSVLKDVLKTEVYALAAYRNRIAPVIPERVISRPPSAELSENQTDEDSLPPYAVLDPIIQDYMEKNLSAEDIIQQGYPADRVHHILALIKKSEYKRRQAAPGIKISPRAFGRDWRYPITSKF
jgi:NAD+ synthase (glutamine-hydrolysing)